jgi:hypothetical protein
MFTLFNRRRLVVVALLAGWAVLIGAAEAFAGEPGESGVRRKRVADRLTHPAR